MQKFIIFFFLISACFNAYSQNKLFVRIYNINSEKTNKGFVLKENDTILHIKKDTTVIAIPVRKIGIIKTRMSGGHNILIGTVIGVTATGILGAASAEPDAEIIEYNAAEGFAAGAIIGAPIGALTGALTAGFKNSKTFIIQGDVEKWKAFQTYLSARTRHE